VELDLERIEAVSDFRLRGKQAGNTTTMMVIAAQHSEFVDRGVYLIVVPKQRDVPEYAEQFFRVSEAMGYRPHRTGHKVNLGPVWYEIVGSIGAGRLVSRNLNGCFIDEACRLGRDDLDALEDYRVEWRSIPEDLAMLLEKSSREVD
tara:strand:- start:212 stop:652 length:441 start_codon:yes stop_codon:yes gene_type:complete